MKIKNFIIMSIFVLLSIPAVLLGDDFLFKPDGSNFYVYGRGTDTFIINQSKLTSSNINKLFEQLSFGKRINSAADDPSGLAVSEKMEALLRQLRQSSMNDEDMRNFYNVVESAIAQDQDLLNRVRELLIQGASGILATDDREIIQSEISELLKQIDMNARFSQFNTIPVIQDLTTKNLGLDKVDIVHNPDKSIGIVDAALTKLTKGRVLKGIQSNILTFRIEGKNWYYVNFVESVSRITDMEMSEGISDLVKNSVILKSQHGLLLRSK